MHSSDYVAILASAIKNDAAREYAIASLNRSLEFVELNPECIDEVCKILLELCLSKSTSNEELAVTLKNFQRKWRIHLDRIYLKEYETVRWDFFVRNVFRHSAIDSGRLMGRVLDIGCGRGCVTTRLVQEGLATNAVGVDTEDFTADWRDRTANNGRVRFEKVPTSGLGHWLAESESFDTVILFYVLHHSTDYWAARLLRHVYEKLEPEGRLIVLEDSLLMDTPCTSANDLQGLDTMWRRWTSSSAPYCGTVGFDVQVILDFVAVQLLAGFEDVGMPCNYKVGEAWGDFFSDIGFKIESQSNLGFQNERDIDVPQALFLLKTT